MDAGNNGMGVRNLVMKLRNHVVGVRDTVANVGNDGMGIQNIVVDVGNNRVGARDVVTNVKNSDVCIYRKLSLGVNNQYEPRKNDGTHVEDKEDPGKVRPPGSDCFLVVLRVDQPRSCIPFAPLDDFSLDLRHSPVASPRVPSTRYSSCVSPVSPTSSTGQLLRTRNRQDHSIASRSILVRGRYRRPRRRAQVRRSQPG